MAGLGVAALGFVAALLGLGAPLLRFFGLAGVAPGRGLIALQTLWTGVRLLGAAAALWALLPPGQIGLSSFVPLFAAATALGALSHVPAGAGVFEFVLLWALRGRAPSEAVAAALIAYRAIYYVLPLVLSAAIFAAFEWRVAFDPKMPRADAKLARAAAQLTPTFVGAVAFAIGVILIFSGATPIYRQAPVAARPSRAACGRWRRRACSAACSASPSCSWRAACIGRRDGAWRLAAAATLASLAFALLKGLAFGEAALLVCFLALLLATRPLFNRPTSLFDQPFTCGWFAAVGAILAAAFGVLWLAFHNAPSRSDDLVAFAFDAQAPRALRAMLGACCSAAGLATWQLLRAPSGRGDAARLRRRSPRRAR